MAEYFEKLKQASSLLGEIKFDCPVITQEIRQKIGDIQFAIDELKTEWVENGYVDKTDLSDVEFKFRYGNNENGWDRLRMNENYPTYTQIRNVTGIEDDDELNAGVEAERHEDLEQAIVMDLGRYEGHMQNFDNVCKLLKDKYGLTYMGGDDERECHVFSNDTETVYVFPKIYYPKQGTMRLRHLYVSNK